MSKLLLNGLEVEVKEQIPLKLQRKVIVVSLFDGLSGGRLATDLCNNLNVVRYYSSEVDKYAIQVADKNYPQDTEFRLGDVTKVDFHKLLLEIKAEFGDVDILLLGGSPCQGFSLAGKMKGSSTKCGKEVITLEQYLELKEINFEFEGQSYLFWEYIRAMKELKPKFFMLENVKVTKKWLPMFNRTMKVDGVLINSNLVSAQDRPRFYWTNINFELPEDLGIELKDILEDIDIFKPLSPYMTKEFKGISRLKKGIFNFTERSKGVCQTTGSGHGCKYLIKGSPDNPQGVRKMTPIEQERTQNLPDDYTSGVKTGAREHMIGNGWTIKVPAHILSFIPLKEVL